jgi:hypothetical protein
MSCCPARFFHSILTVREPVRLPSKGIDDTVFRVPAVIGHPAGATVQRFSVLGVRGIKLYVAEYVTVPPVTVAGTFIERFSVEFCPLTGGSGPKDIEVILKREVDLEQSVTDAFAPSKRARIAMNIYGSIEQTV